MNFALYDAYLKSTGICTDTRAIASGNMFVALKGPSFNANDFVLDALKAGCGHAVADEDRAEFKSHPNIFIVKDGLAALQDLARHHRARLKIPIIGLTGSNGKTTTKELMRAALSGQYECFATHGNLNNHIGVPLSILAIKKHHEIAIIEMGANHKKEIAALCQIARPNYGLITNIGLAHLEGFGGEEGVYIGKKELFDYINENEAIAFVNVDDPKVVKAYGAEEAVTYGSKSGAIYQGSYGRDGDFLTVNWRRADESSRHTITTQLSGEYNFINVMAAVAVARYFGVSHHKISASISNYLPSNNRSQIELTKRGNKVIVDCYNANPTSMKAALSNLSHSLSSNTVAILGDMKELGAVSLTKHQEVLDQCAELDLTQVYLIGPEFSSIPSSFASFETVEDAAAHFASHEIKDSTVLLKGSRSIALEGLMNQL